MFRSDLDKQLQLEAAAARQRREQEIKEAEQQALLLQQQFESQISLYEQRASFQAWQEAEERAHQLRLEKLRSSATNPRAAAGSFRNPSQFSPSTPAGFLPPSSSTSFVTNSFPAKRPRSVSFGDNTFTQGPPAAPQADSARIEALPDKRLKAYGHPAAPSALNLGATPSALSLSAAPSFLATVTSAFDFESAPSALSRGISTSLEMQRTATSLEGRRAATRSFDSSGRPCCMYCGRLACSTSCPLQQCPLGDRSGDVQQCPLGDHDGDGFTRCRGTTLRGVRCKVTSESPSHCGSAPLQLGGQYCEKHTQSATIAPDLSLLQRGVEEPIPPLNPFTAKLMRQTEFLMRIGGMSEDEFEEWSEDNAGFELTDLNNL